MAKAKRIPLNRLVRPETFESVKTLAEVMECSEGEVIDQAVEFFEAHNGGESRVMVSYPPPSVEPSANARTILAEIETKQNIAPARVRETGNERAMRERRERQERAANLDSIQDDSIDRSDEYVSN